MNFEKSNDLVLFFAPEAGVTPHFAGHITLAHTLRCLGYKVAFVRCAGLYSRCPVMDMNSEPAFVQIAAGREDTKTCQQCIVTSHQYLDKHKFDTIDLQDYFTLEIYSEVDRLIENAPENLLDFEAYGIKWGSLASIDFVLATKHHNFIALSHEQRTLWLSLIKSGIISYLLTEKIIKSLPVKRFIYYQDYSVLRGSRLAAEKQSIPCFSIYHGGVNVVSAQQIAIANSIVRMQQIEQVDSWHKWREYPVTPDVIRTGVDDLFSRLQKKAVFIYSPKKTVGEQTYLETLKIDKNKKLIVAFSSSLDEMTASITAEAAIGIHARTASQPFQTAPKESQVSWLRAVIDFAENRSDVQLVIRIHPREGKDGRNNVESEHLQILREAFSGTYKNTVIVWPEDNISSYDLGEIADLALTSISTIGMELARMGVPVLASQKGVSFVGDDFLEWAPTATEYFAKLEHLLNRWQTSDIILRSYRYFHTDRLAMNVGFEDLISADNTLEINPEVIPANSKVIEEVIINCKKITDINLEKLIANKSADAFLAEDIAFKSQVRRILHFLFLGEEAESDYFLVAITSNTAININLDVNQLNPQGSLPVNYILIKGKEVVYIYNGKLYSRFSPAAARLAAICSHNNFTLTAK